MVETTKYDIEKLVKGAKVSSSSYRKAADMSIEEYRQFGQEKINKANAHFEKKGINKSYKLLDVIKSTYKDKEGKEQPTKNLVIDTHDMNGKRLVDLYAICKGFKLFSTHQLSNAINKNDVETVKGIMDKCNDATQNEIVAFLRSEQ